MIILINKNLKKAEKDMKYTFLNDFNTPDTNPVNPNQGIFGVVDDEERQYI